MLKSDENLKTGLGDLVWDDKTETRKKSGNIRKEFRKMR